MIKNNKNSHGGTLIWGTVAGGFLWDQRQPQTTKQEPTRTTEQESSLSTNQLETDVLVKSITLSLKKFKVQAANGLEFEDS